MKCIERGTVVKNVLDSQNLIKVDKVSQKQNRLDEDERKKIENDQALSQYLESDEAQDWTEKQKRKCDFKLTNLLKLTKEVIFFAIKTKRTKNILFSIMEKRGKYWGRILCL